MCRRGFDLRSANSLSKRPNTCFVVWLLERLAISPPYKYNLKSMTSSHTQVILQPACLRPAPLMIAKKMLADNTRTLQR